MSALTGWHGSDSEQNLTFRPDLGVLAGGFFFTIGLNQTIFFWLLMLSLFNHKI